MRHFFLPVTVCALAQCADREHAKAMRERIDGEVQKRWRRSAALVSAAADGDEDRVRVYSTRWVVVLFLFIYSFICCFYCCSYLCYFIFLLLLDDDLLVRPFSEELIWDRVATAGGKDFKMLMRAMMP